MDNLFLKPQNPCFKLLDRTGLLAMIKLTGVAEADGEIAVVRIPERGFPLFESRHHQKIDAVSSVSQQLTCGRKCKVG